MSNYNLDDPVELLCALTEINSVNSTLVPGALVNPKSQPSLANGLLIEDLK